MFKIPVLLVFLSSNFYIQFEGKGTLPRLYLPSLILQEFQVFTLFLIKMILFPFVWLPYMWCCKSCRETDMTSWDELELPQLNDEREFHSDDDTRVLNNCCCWPHC